MRRVLAIALIVLGALWALLVLGAVVVGGLSMLDDLPAPPRNAVAFSQQDWVPVNFVLLLVLGGFSFAAGSAVCLAGLRALGPQRVAGALERALSGALIAAGLVIVATCGLCSLGALAPELARGGVSVVSVLEDVAWLSLFAGIPGAVGYVIFRLGVKAYRRAKPR